MGGGDVGTPAPRRRGGTCVRTRVRGDEGAGAVPSRPRLADLFIAATAAAHGLPLYTRNPGDFVGLDGIVDVIGV